MPRSSQRTAVQLAVSRLDATVIQDRAAARASGPAQPPRLLVVRGARAGAVILLGADELTVGRGWTTTWYCRTSRYPGGTRSCAGTARDICCSTSDPETA